MSKQRQILSLLLAPMRRFVALEARAPLRGSLRDRNLLIITFTLLTLIRLAMWLLPFRTLQSLVNRSSQISSKQAKINIDTITWAVEISSRYMPGGVKCLARALTTQILMNWQGYSSQLRIGVAKENNATLAAHAWVEYQGQVIMGNLSDLERFTPLLSIDSPRKINP